MSADEEDTAKPEHTEEEPKQEPAAEAPIAAEQPGTEGSNGPMSSSPEGAEHPSPNSEQPVEGEMGNHAMPEGGVAAPVSEQHEHMPPPESEEHQAQATTPNHPRYPYPPEGYYPPGYPPPHPSADGGHGYPREAYPGGPPPYGVPPHMGGYPMYSYHQPPMYPHYPGYPPPPMYGYPPPEGYPDQQGVGVNPYAQQIDDVHGEDKGEDKKAHNPVMPSALGSASRLKTYIKPRPPSSQDVLDRRSRKNAQSRARASKLRERIAIIETKPASERTEEEKAIFATFEARRQRKNDRSRERALEKKEEIDRILAKPEKRRTKIEKQFLEGALNAKKRKNEGDRLRRQRLKELGLSSKTTGLKPGISARGPIGIYRGGMPPHPHYGPQMGEIPMSPMPPMGGHHHHHQQSPGGFAAGSPGGMMPGMGFASPQHPRRSEAGVLETPGRQPGPGHLPYIPPSQSYDGQPHQGGGSRVEQRRHADGSMSISIGGEGGGPQYPPEGEQGTDLNDMLLYNDQEGGESAKDV
ncbi:unnamed protein product [Cylindrotheca closterium]|uniref:Uncharacterized protein n=1 Tax=Cylindrotheca closterium TaxID=2856 RepID=A0AAD2G3W8_9STRA|nr:unnamed protein product [Cylindrotheca closterium]